MASVDTQKRPFVACSLCMGSGQDAFAPQRRTANRSIVYLVRACPGCEGRGVVANTIHPSSGTVSNFSTSDSPSSVAPSGVTDMSYERVAVPS